MTGLRAATVAMVVLLVGCDWSVYGFDAAHTSHNSTETTISAANVGSLVEQWSSSNGGNVSQSLPPVISHGVVYASSTYPDATGTQYLGDVYAYDAKNGARRWVRSTNGIPSPPSVANGIVYVGSVDHFLYAFDATTGEVRWMAPTTGEVRSPPTVSDGKVYVASEAGPSETGPFYTSTQYLYAFDAMSGQVSWSSPIGRGSTASPTVAEGMVFIAAGDGRVRAFDAATGAVHWDSGVVSTSSRTVAYANGLVFIGTLDGRLVALRASDGTEAWARQLTPEGFVYAPAVAGGVVYVDFSSWRLSAYNGVGAYSAATGEQLWTAAPLVIGGGGVSVANGVVYVSLRQGLKALDGTTGASLLDLSYDTAPSAAAIADGRVYVNRPAVPGDPSAGVYVYGLSKREE
jgi:eukaryotic-like serine/threonine-protein kinase